MIVSSYAEHTPSLSWMMQYRNEKLMSCCSEKDCRMAEVSIVEMDEENVTVVVNGVTLVLLKARVHLSEDGNAYWCSSYIDKEPTPDITRCVFYAIGS
jgi:hypothetical protein